MENYGDYPQNKDDKCFYCRGAIFEPHVVWDGSNGHTIYLHPKCAKELALHLGKDAILVEMKSRQMLGQMFNGGGFTCHICREVRPLKNLCKVSDNNVCIGCKDIAEEERIRNEQN